MASEHGDLILELPLHVDAAALPQEIAAALSYSQEQINQMVASGKKIAIPLDSKNLEMLHIAMVKNNQAMTDAKIAAEKLDPPLKKIKDGAVEAHARFGVMANSITGASTVMRLFGLESGMAAVESGRLVLYLGRAITSGGGVAGAFSTMASAFGGFVTAIGPVGIAIALVAESIAALKLIMDGYVASQQRAADKADAWRSHLEEEAAITRDLTKARRETEDQLAVAEKKAGIKGGMGEELAFNLGLRRQGVPPEQADLRASMHTQTKRAEDFARMDEEERARTSKGIDEEAEHRRKRILEVRHIREKEIDNYWKREDDADRKAHENAIARTKKQAEELERLAIKWGGRRASEFMRPGSPERRMAQFDEMAEIRLKAAEKKHAGLNIGSIDANEFRFGPGAMGSVVGEQNEQKNTTKAVLEVRDELRKEFALQHGTAGALVPVNRWIP